MSRKRNWTPLIQTQYALDHHARKLKPVVDALLYTLAGSGLTHRLDCSRGRGKGATNSWFVDITNGNGTRRYYLRMRRNPWRLDVNDTYRYSSTLASMENERDVLRVVTQWVAGTL